MQHRNEALPLEKIIAALTYLTSGFVGFFWLVLGFFLKLGVRPFLLYHIYQSIFLSVLIFIVSYGLNIILGFLSVIPFIGQLISTLVFLFTTSVVAGLSVLNIIALLVMVYLIITSLMGKYSYLPWVSNIIKANLRF